jgi:starvation-inducible DNA-binding protein
MKRKNMKINPNKNSSKYKHSNLEKAEIVTNLNKLLANYQVYYQKLRCFYWNIKGQDFFDLRSEFRELCKKTNRQIDDVAERIKFFDQMPLSRWSQYSRISEVKENTADPTGFEMVNEICSDMLKILSIKEECLRTIVEVRDYGTEDLIKSLIHEMEVDYRIFSEWKK